MQVLCCFQGFVDGKEFEYFSQIGENPNSVEAEELLIVLTFANIKTDQIQEGSLSFQVGLLFEVLYFEESMQKNGREITPVGSLKISSGVAAILL